MKLNQIIRRALEVVADVTVETGKITVEKIVSGSEVVIKVATEKFKKHALTTPHEALSLLKEEIGKLDWMGYETEIHDAPDEYVKKHINAGSDSAKGLIGATDAVNYRVIFYIIALVKACNMLWFVPNRQIIRSFVRHEHRHVQQFERMRELGGEEAVGKAMFDEMFTLFYGTSRLEKDAFKYQFGRVQELDEVVAEYVH